MRVEAGPVHKREPDMDVRAESLRFSEFLPHRGNQSAGATTPTSDHRWEANYQREGNLHGRDARLQDTSPASHGTGATSLVPQSRQPDPQSSVSIAPERPPVDPALDDGLGRPGRGGEEGSAHADLTVLP